MSFLILTIALEHVSLGEDYAAEAVSHSPTVRYLELALYKTTIFRRHSTECALFCVLRVLVKLGHAVKCCAMYDGKRLVIGHRGHLECIVDVERPVLVPHLDDLLACTRWLSGIKLLQFVERKVPLVKA